MPDDDIDKRIAAYAARSKYEGIGDKGCVGLLLARYPDRADAIRKVVDASWTIGCSKAASILTEEGITPIADQAIRRHRSEKCACRTR